MKLTDNTILITGGTSGIGLETAKRFSALGNQVIICARSEENLQKTQALLPNVETVRCDVSREAERIALFEHIRTHHGSLNILINNAAITHTADFYRDDEVYRKCLNEVYTNLIAPIHLAKLFLPLLAGNPDAALINITTGLVYTPKTAYPFYNAMKSALHSFTQVLRQQMAGEPVRIVEVLFPVVDTPWYQGNTPKAAISPQQAVDEMLRGLEAGKTELKIGKVKLLYYVHRFFPALAAKIINNIR